MENNKSPVNDGLSTVWNDIKKPFYQQFKNATTQFFTKKEVIKLIERKDTDDKIFTKNSTPIPIVDIKLISKALLNLIKMF